MDKSVTFFVISIESGAYSKITTTPIAESKDYIFFDEGLWIGPILHKEHILRATWETKDPGTIFIPCYSEDEKQALKILQDFFFDSAMGNLNLAYLTEKLNQYLTPEPDGLKN